MVKSRRCQFCIEAAGLKRYKVVNSSYGHENIG